MCSIHKMVFFHLQRTIIFPPKYVFIDSIDVDVADQEYNVTAQRDGEFSTVWYS